MSSAFDRCEFLLTRWKNLALWRNLWSILIFVLGASVALWLAAAVWLYTQSSWLPAVLTTLGTLVSGVAASWVLARRNDAVAEEVDAKRELLATCGGPGAAAPKGQGDERPTTADQVRAIEARLALLGKFR